MEITINDITSVDKEVIISAVREDLEPKFKEAYKKYRGQINMPGFRPGKVPIKIIKKRFGDEIESEEINNYVQEVFEQEVVPEHDPVGESKMLELSWEDDELEAKFKIGARPDFELTELSEITVDQLVHDVTDEEVQEEIDRQLHQAGNWEVVDDEIEDDFRVTVDAVPLDDDGEPDEENTNEEVIDLSKEESEQFRDDLIGQQTGDSVAVEIGHDDHTHSFHLNIKKVEKPHKADFTDEFAKQQSNEEAKNTEEYRSLVKSQIQDQYDDSAGDIFKNEIIDALVEKHDFEIPDVFMNQILNQYVERVKQQSQGELPPDFDEEEYKENMRERAERDGMWFFLNEKLQEKFDDIEIEPEDIDQHLEGQAAQYGMSVDQMRNMFAQNPQQLENLRKSIREEKVFDKLKDVVEINEIDKETYQEKMEEQAEA
ncbi:trigger factor [Fodinibius salinus]|uniref:Trigger factor n=1 Tax=Fodinibius salinus TaxID=860790 RepID=A0A5D3YKA1_9BACT|nr:trigger factor [Fodinibius salinus]TYP93928.1 trigger factor [Fodinibius salinus]